MEDVNLKNSHKLKVELCFIQWEFLGLQPQERALQVTLRKLLLGDKQRSQVIYKFCNKGQVVWTSKEYY